MAAGKAIILIGHGSSDPLWRQPMDAVAERIRAEQPGLPVRCAFLELEQPDFRSAANELVREGATSITIVPMFLGTGRHARDDLPRLLHQLRADHPAMEVVLQRPVGEDPRLLELLAKIALA